VDRIFRTVPSVAMERKMSPTQLTIGCSVIVAASVGGLISSNIVNRHIPPSTNPRERAVAGQNQNENVGKGICFTLGGKQFEWNFPNVPFGALRCSN
jgi:hypothetical protein